MLPDLSESLKTVQGELGRAQAELISTLGMLDIIVNIQADDVPEIVLNELEDLQASIRKLRALDRF